MSNGTTRLDHPAHDVRWTIDARQQLLCHLARLEPRMQTPPPVEVVIGNLTPNLRRLLCEHTCITVLSLFTGFRPRAGQYILLVEALNGRGLWERWIAKLVQHDDPARVQLLNQDLLDEGGAWRAAIGHNDPVLLPARLVPDGASDVSEVCGLLYEDAGQFIGGEVVSLEAAFLSSVMFATPLPSSIENTLVDMYDRLGLVLYRTASTETIPEHHSGEGAAPQPYSLGIRHFPECLNNWRNIDAASRARRDVNSVVRRGAGYFRDPVDALTFVATRLNAPLAPGVHRVPRRLLVPVLLRGAAHGDLHGRNVRVGLWNHEARFPAVYDYEDLAFGTCVGWDFVKMETELKIRAYPLVFPTSSRIKFIADVQRFEEELCRATEAGTWPAANDDPARSRADRLRDLLLIIRRSACQHLMAQKQREGRWLMEYYFLLAVYGTMTGRFNNHDDELRGAFVSAGVSMARYYYSHEQNLFDALVPPDAPPRTPPAGAEGYPTHDEPLRYARKLIIDGEFPEAEAILDVLEGKYPHVLEVVAERAHLLLSRGDAAGAKASLERAMDRFETYDEEFCGRLGRLAKDEAAAAAAAGEPATALGHYEQAAMWYEKGYGLAGGHYSGVNLCTILLYTAALRKQLGRDPASALKDMKSRAAELLARHKTWHAALDDDKTVWHPATQGELSLLLEDWLAAKGHYGVALAAATAKQRDDSILPQARRIREMWKAIGVVPPEGALPEGMR